MADYTVIEYVLNLDKRRLHVKVDGMSYENCNLDQLLHSSTVTDLQQLPDGKWSWCMRCRSRVSAGGVL